VVALLAPRLLGLGEGVLCPMMLKWWRWLWQRRGFPIPGRRWCAGTG
jgi:hypothetical protein